MRGMQPRWRLDRATDAGLRWVAAGELEALLAAGRDAGLHGVRIDLGACRDKAALLEQLAGALGFPGWYGHNWDALADCLGDLSWLPDGGVLLALENCRPLAAAAPQDYRLLLDILDDTASAWRARAVPFWALISMAPPQQRPPGTTRDTT